MSTKPYVLLVGYRQQLAKALLSLGIPYSVWTEKELKAKAKGADRVLTAPVPKSKPQLIAQLETLNLPQTPTHVIAGTESAVFPSAIIRRFYDARHSPKTILVRCTDKVAMKLFLQRYGVPMTKFAANSQDYSAQELVKQLGLPLVIKTRKGSGSRNLVIAHTLAEVEENLGRHQIYEAFIDAPEGSVESFIHGGKIFFTNVTEYYRKKHINLVPAGYAADEISDILELNQFVIKALKIKWGMTHLEFYRSRQGILFGEIALRPPGGYIMELLRQSYGFDAWQTYVKIELGLEVAPIRAAARFSACHVLHPGAGTILEINDAPLRSLPHVRKVKIKAAPGDVVSVRQGVGEDLGYVMYGAPTYEALVKTLDHPQVFVMAPTPDAP